MNLRAGRGPLGRLARQSWGGGARAMARAGARRRRAARAGALLAAAALAGGARAGCGEWGAGKGGAVEAAGGFAAAGVELDARLPPLGGVAVRLGGPGGAGAVLHEGRWSAGGRPGGGAGKAGRRQMHLAWADGGPAMLRERAALREVLGDVAVESAIWRPQDPLWRVLRGDYGSAAKGEAGGEFVLEITASGEAGTSPVPWEEDFQWKLILCDTQYELMDRLWGLDPEAEEPPPPGRAGPAAEGGEDVKSIPELAGDVHAKALPAAVVGAAKALPGGGGTLGVAALEFAAAEAFALAHHDATVGVVAFKRPEPPGAPAPAAKTVLDHFQNPPRPGA